MTLVARQPSHPLRTSPDSLVAALADAVVAGQDLVLDRLGLLRAEIDVDATRLAKSGAVLAGAGALAALGWTLLSAGLAVFLARFLAVDVSLALVGGVNLAAGVASGRFALGAPLLARRPRE